MLLSGAIVAQDMKTVDAEINNVIEKKSKELSREMNLSRQQKEALREAAILYENNVCKFLREAENPLFINEKRMEENIKHESRIKKILIVMNGRGLFNTIRFMDGLGQPKDLFPEIITV
jgi:uncharacterized protein YaiL (DUF2058 family)